MIVVVDDEYDYAIFLKGKLKKYYKDKKIEILTEFNFEFITNNDVDILFLDIELDNVNGIELANEYRKLGYEDTYIVFISAHDNYVYDTFGTKPIDFIRKGQIDNDLEKCVKLIEREKKRKEMQIIIEGHKINLVNIFYIESQGNKAFYRGINNKEILERRIKLSDVEIELEKYNFLRCHKSYIINIIHISMLYTDSVILKDNTEISISRSCREHFFEKYRGYRSKKLYTIG